MSLFDAPYSIPDAPSSPSLCLINSLGYPVNIALRREDSVFAAQNDVPSGHLCIIETPFLPRGSFTIDVRRSGDPRGEFEAGQTGDWNKRATDALLADVVGPGLSALAAGVGALFAERLASPVRAGLLVHAGTKLARTIDNGADFGRHVRYIHRSSPQIVRGEVAFKLVRVRGEVLLIDACEEDVQRAFAESCCMQ